MASQFNLTAQLNLRGPTNVRPIVNQIRKELGEIKADVKFNIDPKASKTIDVTTGKLKAMNAVLVTSKNHVNDLNRTFQQLSSSLSGVKGGFGNVASGMKGISSSAKSSAKDITVAANAMEEFGRQGQLAVKRFAAFSIVTKAVYSVVNAVQSGTTAFIEFDRQLVRLQQVTGSGSIGIKSISDEITRLSTSLGVGSDKLAQVAVTLAQAGYTAGQTKTALEALAKTELAPTFDNITNTTEGAIAAMAQFNIETRDLEKTLGSINAVAARFAVESSDIITGIQRAGAVFASSSKGVSESTDALNEFVAVFTAVRATTRESAETIATGLRTVFTRIQRPQTIEFLRQYGVELTDLEGKFIGPYKAAEELSTVLRSLDPRDLRFGQIVEELGGFRQINKVIPILQNFDKAKQALEVARAGGGSLTKDQIIAEQSLAVQLAKVREEFLALIRAVGQSTTFKVFFGLITKITSGLIKLAGVFKPLLPALAILGTVKVGKAAVDFGSGFFGAFKKGGGSGRAGQTLGETVTGSGGKGSDTTMNMVSEALKENTSAIIDLTQAINDLAARGLNGGGKVLGFATGGLVPGSGNRDTVPAMLSPGEYVIRKKAVESIGASNLRNLNGYANGGPIRHYAKAGGVKKLTSAERTAINAYAKSLEATEPLLASEMRDIVGRSGAGAGVKSGRSLQEAIDKGNLQEVKNFVESIKRPDAPGIPSSIKIQGVALRGNNLGSETKEILGSSVDVSRYVAPEDFSKKFIKAILTKVRALVGDLADMIESEIPNFNPNFKGFSKEDKTSMRELALETNAGNIIGDLFERALIAAGATLGPKGVRSGNRPIDLSTLGPAAAIFGADPNQPTEVKASAERLKLTPNLLEGQISRYLETFQRKASGGSIQDTVPALLTPGEFVVNKKAAQKIGYARLNKLNKADKLQGYNKGGPVGFATGGAILPGGRELPDDPTGAEKAALAEQILANAAKAAGMTLAQFEKQVKQSILAETQAMEAQRATTREILKSRTTRTAGTGFDTDEDRLGFIAATSADIKAVSGSRISDEQIAITAEVMAGMAESGKSFDEILESSAPSIVALREAMDSSRDSTEALAAAEQNAAKELGALTEAARATAQELELAKYVASGQNVADLGRAGQMNPAVAKAFAESAFGERALSTSRSILGDPSSGRLGQLLGALPGSIGKALSSAISKVGGRGGLLAAGASILGDQLPNILSTIDKNLGTSLGKSTTLAGVGGALATGGSRAVSMATLGMEIAGPLGGAIGLIGGAISGAIEGYFKGARAKQLENSLEALSKATEEADKALRNLASFDSASNLKKAQVATAALTDNIKDLGAQADPTALQTGGSMLSKAVEFGSYGAIAGAFIGSIIPGLGTAIGAAIGGAAGAIAGAVTGFFSTDEINDEALKSQLKAIDSYISGIQQISERRINLQSIDEIRADLDAYEAATEPGARAAAGAQRSTFLQEAQRASLVREGSNIQESQSVNEYLQSASKKEKATASMAKKDAAIALAMQELNRIYDGNIDAIRRESKDKEKLIQRGYELAAQMDEQAKLEAQMALAMKDVRVATESLIETFRKMNASIQEASDNVQMLGLRAAGITGGGTTDFNAEGRALNNMNALNDAQFNQLVDAVSQGAGGGEAGNLLAEGLRGRRVIETELPGILRGATKNDVKDVTEQLESVLRRGGVTNQTAIDTILKKVGDQLNQETGSRQGKSFDELLEEFPALADAISPTTAALETSKLLIQELNDAIKAEIDIRQKINASQLKSLEIEVKRIRSNIEMQNSLDSTIGRLESRSGQEAVIAEVRGLTGGITDAGDIGEAQRAAMRRRFDLEQSLTGIQTPDEKRQTQLEIEAANQEIDRFGRALEILSDNTEKTAIALENLSNLQTQKKNLGSLFEKLATGSVEDVNQTYREGVAFRGFSQGDKTITNALGGAFGPEVAKDIFAGFDTAAAVSSLPQEVIQAQRNALSFDVLQARTPGKDIGELLGPNIQKVIDEKTGKVSYKYQQVNMRDFLKEGTLEQAYYDAAQAAQAEKDKAFIELTKTEKLVEEQLRALIPELAANTAALQARLAASAAAQTRTNTGTGGGTRGGAGGGTGGGAGGGVRMGGGAQAVAFREAYIAGQQTNSITGANNDLVRALHELKATFTDEEKQLFGQLKGGDPSINASFIAANEIAIRREEAQRAKDREAAAQNPPTPVQPGPTPLTGPALSPSAMFDALGINAPVNTETMLQSLLSGISTANPLPVTVVNVAEFGGVRGGPNGATAPENLPSFFVVTADARNFLTSFDLMVSTFGGYVTRLEKVKLVPDVVQMRGTHTVDVKVSGAAAFEAIKGDFAKFIQAEINKEMQRIWSKTGGSMGSSGAGSRPLQGGAVQY